MEVACRLPEPFCALAEERVLACSGSTPPASPDDAYARLVRIAAERDAIAIVDATAATLGEALAAGPYVVTPNLAEAEELLTGRGDDTVDALAAAIPEHAAGAARALMRCGARAAVVTAGTTLDAAVATGPWTDKEEQ